MKRTHADGTKEKRDSAPIGLILAIVFALLYFVLGAGRAQAQDVQPAGGSDSLAITLQGMATAGAFGSSITTLPNGNFVVVDPLHDAGNIDDVGSVILYDGDSLRVISRTFGSKEGSQIGVGGITVLADGNFVIGSPLFGVEGAAEVGAVTWCSATLGCANHVVAANSLIGTTAGDHVGVRVVEIGESGYVVQSPNWRHAGVVDAGAVTRCNPVADCMGTVVESENSLVGGAIGDRVGAETMTILANGDYVVRMPVLDANGVPDTGAVIRCAAVGVRCEGHVSAANALVGATPFDNVGYSGVYAVGEGYVVASPHFDFGVIVDVGAVTYCAMSCVGAINALNSLISTSSDDNLGIGGIVAVDGGNGYVISSPSWDAAAADDVGAVTYCQTDAPCVGFNVKARSLYGVQTGDRVGESGVTPLASGDYVVASAGWSNIASNVGAVTQCSGATGCQDVAVSTTNSVYGSTVNDRVAQFGVQALAGGGYVISSPSWDNAGMVDTGAVTWCSALGCAPGPVSIANSVVGTNTLDGVATATTLNNGNYVVSAPNFNVGALTDAGKAILCDGETGCLGAMGAIAGLEGSSVGQNVASEILPLANGNFLVRTANFDAGGQTGVGAVTRCSGTSGCPAQVSDMNSVYGARTNDKIGADGMVVLGNGDALLLAALADSATHSDAGAITWMRGDVATHGAVSELPTIYGGINGAGGTLTSAFNHAHHYLIGGLPAQNKVVVLMARPGLFVTLAGNGKGSVTSSTGEIACGDDCLESALAGASITLTATPAASSTFTGWSGACSGTGACVVTVQGATQVTATFALKMLSVTLPDTYEGGTVTVSVVAVPAEVSSAGDVVEVEAVAVEAAETSDTVIYAYGTVMSLTATPDPDHVFVGWTGDKSGKENPLQFQVTQALTIGAIFRSVDAPDPELDVFLPVVNR